MLTMKDIVREGHPALRKTAEEVQVPPSQEEINLLNKMLTFLKNSQDEEIAEKYNLRSGVGLAAPQINVNKRLIVIHYTDHKDQTHTYQLINPKIISHSVQKAYLANGEGCLSVDRDVEGYVVRHARITVQATNIDGEKIKLRLRGFLSIIFQHEIDHLNGVMFFDHIDPDNPFNAPTDAIIIE